MRYTSRIAFAALLPLLCSAPGNAKTEKVRPEKVTVSLVARSTAAHVSWGESQDVYLAEMRGAEGGAATWIKLVDEYPGTAVPLIRVAYYVQKDLALRVIRDSQCDAPLSQIPLRTAPGDAMAILAVRLSYSPMRSDLPGGAEQIPCYRNYRK